MVAVLLVGFLGSFAQSNQSSGTQRSEINAKPLLLEKSEGELRTRRIHTNASIPASSQFMLKVSPKSNGSHRLVAGTEDLAPGANLPKHRHLTQDEIVLIHSGTAHVWLGDQERDLHAGGTCVHPCEYVGECEEYWYRTD
jgi:mannose-6-phosphate isomerase-like protein (cupin superfamily)